MATRHTRFVRSAYILAAVALAWTGGIILLHVTYVQPNLDRQADRIDQETAGQWLRLANYFIRNIRSQMLRLNANWADNDGLRRYFQSGDEQALAAVLPPDSLARNRLGAVCLCAPDGAVLSAWMAEGGRLLKHESLSGANLGPTAVFRLSPPADEVGGLGDGPLGLAVFARSAVRDRSGQNVIGHIVSLRPMDALLFGELSAMVGVNVSLQAAPNLPPGAGALTFGQASWRNESNSLCGAQVLRDSLGLPAGHLLAQGKTEQARRHTRTVEQALGTTLVWSIGFAGLMILVIHVVVSGPTARLVDRVERLRRGQEVQPLSGGLRGEALVLSRRFEEVLSHVEKLSQTDSLTGLPNRRSFQQTFVREFRRARRYARPLALCMMDLDFFKAANDALGHAVGDTMLKVFAQVITDSVRLSDTVARLGGDEFAVLMPETTSEAAMIVADRIRRCLSEKTIRRGELKMTPTTSIGLVDLNAPGADTPEAILDMADQALYAAKRAGRNRTVRAEEIDVVAAAESTQNKGRVDDLCKQLAGLDAKFKRLFLDAIDGLISALEARDKHTANHSGKVRRYAMLIARQMQLPDHLVDHVGRAAVLHDIGKIGLPDSVLLKETALDEEQWQIVRRHPVMSVRIMEGMEFLDQEIPFVRYHHERYDGGGYPEGLCGSAIPLGARILSVADAFDAMTSSRVYRGGLSVEHALGELRRGSGTQFDPAIVDAFLAVVRGESIDDRTLAAVTAQS